jgi:DNA-binding response OmpR family regulator
VLLDIMTPDVDGLNVLHQLHALRPALKVVIMTAENTSSNLMAAIREQAFSYFSKPFAIPAVVDSVLRALEAEMGEDDIQVVSSRPQWVSLNVRCRLETADRIAQFFREMDMGLSADEQEQAVTAFRELLMNAIEHGCHTDPNVYPHVARGDLCHPRSRPGLFAR